jgi:hypothetical protein
MNKNKFPSQRSILNSSDLTPVYYDRRFQFCRFSFNRVICFVLGVLVGAVLTAIVSWPFLGVSQ